MFERFTADARAVVVDAVGSADQVTPQELLEALLATDRGIATATLRECGVTAESLHSETPTNDLDQDADVLASIGIDLAAIRESLEQAFGKGALDEPAGIGSRRGRFAFPRSRFEKDAKKVLELSLREAVAHKSNHIGAEHILLGILRVADGPTRVALEAQVSIPEIRSRLESAMRPAA
ncbi:Clp protease [Rhodococcus sp. AD45-ID]|uniref:Clp protease N-terminal domain-containing protein n=1 Tax=unclassified Rhodococcus (in: high G+C Gram-positive bacteria) TaxID=192944 RepID=UPI0005D41F9D|nr:MULTISPECIES: Clp protease N-terminal domain-containing protein [unclassified Rhodococcus (in: high G+C Gram-positive bacteria)]KJF23104.1 putative ATP-dependent Clp protease ATP-binding subunit [Rhodococcus sp. AD45]PSR41610.1 Clp protease [Rhodococcus sp. AD45-ID]ROZ49349.1 ATP-dependent Clp protease ATP-binding subunit [Rhodococcus sp. WS3]